MHPDAGTRTFGFGPSFRINTSDRLLLCDGKVIHLYPKAIDILLALLVSNGRVLKKDDLISVAWGDISIEENALAKCVAQLRKALGDDPNNPTYIRTIHKAGYQWLTPVSQIQDRFPDTPPSVAVFPFQSLLPDPSQSYFSTGMTETLLASLGKIEILKVIAYSCNPANSAHDPVSVGQSLGAGFVVTGSVLEAPDRVRITAHLQDVRTRQQIWVETYDVDIRDVLDTLTVVSRKIAQEIRIKLTPQDQARLAASHKVVPSAYYEYLKGRYHWNRRTPGDFRKAMDSFQRAIDLDPQWAVPHAGLADSYLLLGSTSYDALPPREAVPKAKAAATAALRLDSSNAEAHTSMAYALMVYDWDLPAAEKEFRLALDLEPGYPTAHHWYAFYLLASDQPEKAVAEMKTAWERDPLSLAINTGLGWVHYLTRQYDDAIVHYRKTLEMDDKFVLAHCMLGMAYEQNGRRIEALAQFQLALSLVPENLLALARLGRTYAVAGNRDQSLSIVRRLKELSATRYVPSTYPAAIFAALGDYDQAFASFDQALDERAHYLVYLNQEPSLDDFRADGRFPDLARRIGLKG